MKKNILLVVLVLIIIGLGGYIIYDKTIEKDVSNNEINSKEELKKETEEKIEEEIQEKEYTYNELAGNYYFETDAKIDVMPGAMARFYLVLDEKGTFNYTYSSGNNPMGILGTYTIEDNSIILNYAYSTNGGSGIEKFTGTKKLEIDENSNLIDNESLVKSISGTKIVLSKTNTPNENFKTYDEIINNN